MAGLQSALIASSGGSSSGPLAHNPATAYVVGQKAVSNSDFCDYVRKVAGTTATDPASDSTNWQPSGRKAVKSTQRGLISISSGGVNTGTATISAVNTAKCSVRPLGWSDASGGGYGAGYVVLTNSTTVTATNGGGTTGSVVAYEIEETY